jgi:hypothetical protein
MMFTLRMRLLLHANEGLSSAAWARGRASDKPFTNHTGPVVLALTLVLAALAAARSPADASNITANASTQASVVPTYGVTPLPLTGANIVIAPDGEYVAGYGYSGISGLHLTAKGIHSNLLPVPGGGSPAITSVSNDGLVAGCASCGVSGESYPFASPFVVGPNYTDALAPPCLFYPEPSTFSNGEFEDCGVKWHGTATMGYLQYRAESAYVNGDEVVEGEVTPVS